MALLKLGIGLAVLFGVTFTGTVQYVENLDSVKPQTEEQRQEELLEYIINNNPSKIKVVDVKPMETEKVEGLEGEYPKFDDVKSDEDYIRILYKNYLKESVTGEKQPTHTFIIARKELEEVYKIKITPQDAKTYNQLVKDGKVQEAEKMMNEIIEESK